jgi:uncharacterized protein
MASRWTALQKISPAGQEFLLDDQAIWTDPIAEFGLACRIAEPVSARIFLLPQEGGILVRGRLRGKVALPCNRCMEDALVDLEHAFESFEPFPPFPGEEDGESDPAVDREVVRLEPHSLGVEINLAALAWEEFSLAVPANPLCAAGCKGLCPQCGTNKNLASCDCAPDTGDPRLAVLRGLTVRR